MYDDSQHMTTSYILLYYIKAWKKVYNWIRTKNLAYIKIGLAREVFYDNVILFTLDEPYVII